MKRASIRPWVGYKERTFSLLLLRLIWLEFQTLTASKTTSTPVQLGLATLVGAKRGRLERPLRKMRRCPVLWNLVMEPCNGSNHWLGGREMQNLKRAMAKIEMGKEREKGRK